MKVLELCLSHGVGGLELYVVRTARHLIRFDCECFAVVKAGTLLAERMKSEGIYTIHLRRMNSFSPFLAASRLATIIDREAVDVIHMHWGKDINLAVLAKFLAKRKVKLVYSRQMMITRSKKDPYHRLLYGHIDLCLTITRQLRDKARSLLPVPERSVQLLYHGVDEPAPLSAAQRQKCRRELGVYRDSDIIIGLIGRIEAGKGQHLLIEAIHRLCRQGLSVHGTLIGPVMDASYYSRIQAQVAQLELQNNITFYGSHQNPLEIMPAFDVVALTSKRETFGLVLIEAMRAGVAVIGSEAGGVPEIIVDGVSGLLFKSDDAVDLAFKLGKYVASPELRVRLAAAGKARADVFFCTERHYRDLAKFFRTLH